MSTDLETGVSTQKENKKDRGEQSQHRGSRRTGGTVASALLLLAVGVVLVTSPKTWKEGTMAVVNPRKLESSSSSISSKITITIFPMETSPPVNLLLGPLQASTSDALKNTSSPQYQAYAWLEQYPNVEDLPLWRTQQLFALATFYYAFNGDDWTPIVRDNWLLYDTHECDWYSSINAWHFEHPDEADETPGLSNEVNTSISRQSNNDERLLCAQVHEPLCNNDSQYEKLAFEWNEGMEGGKLFPEIGYLTALERLDIWGSYLGVALDDILQPLIQLPNLKSIGLGTHSWPTLGNWRGLGLTGTIMTEIGLMQNLESLDLVYNAITGSLPTEIGSVTAFERLLIAHNRISGPIPTQIGHCSPLEYLSLATNAITGNIPSQIGRFQNMSRLYLARNSLSGSLPSEIASMVSLRSLSLSTNRVAGLPSEVGLLPELEDIILDANAISRLPTEIGLLSNLRSLELSQNMISNLPTEIGMLSSLHALDIRDNLITGTLPSQLGNLFNLSSFYLQNNRLRGRVPSEIGSMTSLSWIDWSTNGLSGTIPTEAGLATAIYELRMAENALTGTIPEEIGQLTSVGGGLDFSFNSLTGTIPSSLGGMTGNEDNGNLGLKELNLQANELSGTLPIELFQLSDMESLQLNDNELSGTLPTQLSLLASSLRWLSLSENKFSGTIPTEYGLMRWLREFNVGDNDLEGTVPSQLGSLDPKISVISLWGDDLSGTLPVELCPWFCHEDDIIEVNCADSDDEDDSSLQCECDCSENTFEEDVGSGESCLETVHIFGDLVFLVNATADPDATPSQDQARGLNYAAAMGFLEMFESSGLQPRGVSSGSPDGYEPELLLDEDNRLIFPLAIEMEFRFRECGAPTREDLDDMFARVDYGALILAKYDPQGNDDPFNHLTGDVFFAGNYWSEP